MSKINQVLVSFVVKQPILFRVLLSLAGVIAGIFHFWFGTETTMELSGWKIGILIGFSTLVYTLLLTLYRVFQRIFKRRSSLTNDKKDFDERTLVQAAGIFWFFPYGLTAYLLPDEPDSFGLIMIIQGLAFTLGAWVSKLIKK